MKSLGSYSLTLPILAAVAFGLYPPAARLAYAEGANPVFVVLLSTFLRAASLVNREEPRTPTY